jgi:4-carboxymuconolactone decarboxylase
MLSTGADAVTVLQGLANMEPSVVEDLVGAHLENVELSGLSPREYALVKIAGLVGIDASPASFAWQVGFARESGVTGKDLLGILIALQPTVGNARIVSAATEMAYVLGGAPRDGNPD